jgi:hypothetical protein
MPNCMKQTTRGHRGGTLALEETEGLGDPTPARREIHSPEGPALKNDWSVG